MALAVNQREEDMQDIPPFHVPLTDYPPLMPYVTDTARPQQSIPVYYFHSFEQPFCNDPACQCHWKQQEVRRLLASIIQGELTLKEAANLIDAENEGER